MTRAGIVRVYLHGSSEAVGLSEPFVVGQRVEWFVRRPSELLTIYSTAELAERLSVDASMLDDDTFAIEDLDGYSLFDDEHAVWLSGTIVAISPVADRWASSALLVDLGEVSTTSVDDAG
jgi:hypothetical protein